MTVNVVREIGNPGNRACAVKALGLCRDLAVSPAVVDLGCGVGGQTLHLSELTSGTVVAIDSHAASIERLRATAAARGLSHRIRAGLPPASFDLAWSAGALYNFTLPDEA